jgi:hypothetical protein
MWKNYGQNNEVLGKEKSKGGCRKDQIGRLSRSRRSCINFSCRHGDAMGRFNGHAQWSRWSTVWLWVHVGVTGLAATTGAKRTTAIKRGLVAIHWHTSGGLH